MFCIGMVGFWISRLLLRTGLGFVDRLWGGLLGSGKALVLAVSLISALTFFLSAGSPALRGSLLTPYVQESARFVVQATPKSVQNLFNEKMGELKRYWQSRGDEGRRTVTRDKQEVRADK